ncbi:MAG: hypothetical protein WD757_00465 [Actinomycetota bacterium]
MTADGPQGEQSALPIILLVAPCPGRLKILPPKEFSGGSEWVEPGQPVARIEDSHGEAAGEVLSTHRGRLGGIMGRDGEPVKAGQPVAWIEAAGEAVLKAVPGKSA